jgi:hypothetical protein
MNINYQSIISQNIIFPNISKTSIVIMKTNGLLKYRKFILGF